MRGGYRQSVAERPGLGGSAPGEWFEMRAIANPVYTRSREQRPAMVKALRQ